MKTSKKSLALAVILSLGVCANAWAAGSDSVKVGASTDLGNGASASGTRTIAIGGTGTSANGTDSIAIGSTNTYAISADTIAVGNSARAGSINSIAIGKSAIAGKVYGKYDAIAIGNAANAEGYYALALGTGAKASGNDANAIGSNTLASGLGSVAIGGVYGGSYGDGGYTIASKTLASKAYTTALGTNTTASGIESTAVGYGSEATGDQSFAAGGADASGEGSVAIGRADASGLGSVAIGGRNPNYDIGATAKGEDSVAIGATARTQDYNDVAIGTASFARGGSSTAVGNGASAMGNQASVLGSEAWTHWERSDETAVGSKSVVVGDESVAVGFGASAGNRDWDREDLVWLYTRADYSSAFGSQAKTSSNYSTALGYAANAYAEHSVALGSNSHANEAYTVSVGGEWETYETGEAVLHNIKRRITNVAAAKTPTDALTFNNFKYAQGEDKKNYITEMVIGNDTYYFKVGETITLDPTLDPNSTNGVENQAVAKADIATNDKIGDINNYSSTNYIAQGDSTVTSIGKLDAALNKTDNKVGDINNYSSTNYISQGDSTVTSIGKLDAQVKNNADSITKETSERIAADKDLQEQINNLGGNLAGDVERLDSDVKSVGAMAAAMAGLHPRFTGDGKGEVAAAIGSYDGKKATAIGAFYAPDERFMFSLGGAFAAGGKKMANLGVNIALDPKPHVNKKFYEQEILELKASNQAQAEQLNAQAQQLNDQAAQIKALMNRLAALESK